MTNTPSITLPSGASMPALGLGTWKSDAGVVGEAVKEAIKLGYRHVDCAAIYGNEAEIGSALKGCFDEGLVSRDELFVTSKLWNTNHHPDDVEEGLKQTLADLQLDYVDLYLIHWPVAMKKGSSFAEPHFYSLEQMPLENTWEAMEACVKKGLARDIGVSNCSMKKLEGLLLSAKVKPAVNQVERHPYLQHPDLMKFCDKNGIHVTGYAGLGSGDRPPALKRTEEPILLQDPIIAGIAGKHGCTNAQVLLKWAIQSGASTIPKSTSAKRLLENLECLKVTLDDEDMGEIAKLDRHRRYVDGSFWCKEGGPYSMENLWDE